MSHPFTPEKTAIREAAVSWESSSPPGAFEGTRQGVATPFQEPWARPWDPAWPERPTEWGAPDYVSQKERDAQSAADKATRENVGQAIRGEKSFESAKAEQKLINAERDKAVQEARAEVNQVLQTASESRRENLRKTLRGEQSIPDAFREQGRINDEKARGLSELGAEERYPAARQPYIVY